MKLQNGFSIAVVIFLVAILCLGSGLYLYKKSSNPEPLAQETAVGDHTDVPVDSSTAEVTTKDEVTTSTANTDWKIFYDAKLKIGVSYPPYFSLNKEDVDNLPTTKRDFVKIQLTDSQNKVTVIVFPVDASSRLNGKDIKAMLVDGAKVPDAQGRPKTLTVDGKTFYITYDDTESYAVITSRGIVDVSFPRGSSYSQSDIKQILASLKY